MRHILSPLAKVLTAQQPAILVTIIEQSGSAPRSSGARMFIDRDGNSYGTIGGGIVEKSCQTEALKMFTAETHSKILDFTLDSTSAAEDGMICGGAVKILLQKTTPQLLPLITLLQQEYAQRSRPLLLTKLPKGEESPELTVITNAQIKPATDTAPLPAELVAAIRHKMEKRRTPFTTRYNKEHYFAEPLIDPGCLYIVGAGHVSLATARLAGSVDFTVKVMDDRADFANHNRFPDVDEIIVLPNFTNCLPELGANDYVVIVTRGHAHDQEVAEQALASGAGYIGMIGSRKKWAVTIQKLIASGFTQTEIDRIHCPIGLAIGADTPEEIAISIIAELVAHRAGKN